MITMRMMKIMMTNMINFIITIINDKMFIPFLILNLIYVILNVVKSILQIKGGKCISAISSAICYAFYTIILKSITNCSYEVSIIATIISNLIGTYLGILVSEKLLGRPCTSWKITTDDYIALTNIMYNCRELEIGAHYVKAFNSNYEPVYKISAYTKNRQQDRLLKSCLNSSYIKCSSKYHKEQY